MKLREQLRSAMEQAWPLRKPVPVEASAAPRKTVMLPGIFSPWQAAERQLPKPTPGNLRRFAETPVVRRAINLIKDQIASMDWQVRLKRGYSRGQVPDADQKLRTLRCVLEEPNASDSFRTLMEQVLEDALVGGFGAIEMELTADPERPVSLWPVDGATIEINPGWDGSIEMARYAQATGRPGESAKIPLRDDQLIYLRTNVRSHTPFGLGALEVAFESVNALLSAHRFAAKLASNSVVQYALWLNEATPSQHERLIRWWQDEVEGTGRVPLLSTENKPEVLRFGQGTDADLRMAWQQFLIRMVANAFGIPAMYLGVENDVNRSTAAEHGDAAFRGAILPMAKLVAEHITRDLFAKKLGWREFEFAFNDLEARDEQTEVNIQTALLKAGVYTVDEVRAMRGLAPKAEATAANEQDMLESE